MIYLFTYIYIHIFWGIYIYIFIYCRERERLVFCTHESTFMTNAISEADAGGACFFQATSGENFWSSSDAPPGDVSLP